MKNFAEEVAIAAGFVPLDLAAAAQTGDVVSMKNYRHLVIFAIKAAGAATEPATLTIEQGTDVGFTTAKALNFTRADVKRGADLYTQGAMTKITQTSGNTLAMDGTAGNTQVIAIIEFNSEDLDGENGYDCVRAKFADVGTTAQLCAIAYFGFDPRYAPPPSIIVD